MLVRFCGQVALVRVKTLLMTETSLLTSVSQSLYLQNGTRDSAHS